MPRAGARLPKSLPLGALPAGSETCRLASTSQRTDGELGGGQTGQGSLACLSLCASGASGPQVVGCFLAHQNTQAGGRVPPGPRRPVASVLSLVPGFLGALRCRREALCPRHPPGPPEPLRARVGNVQPTSQVHPKRVLLRTASCPSSESPVCCGPCLLLGPNSTNSDTVPRAPSCCALRVACGAGTGSNPVSGHPGVHPSAPHWPVRAGASEGRGGWARSPEGRGAVSQGGPLDPCFPV